MMADRLSDTRDDRSVSNLAYQNPAGEPPLRTPLPGGGDRLRQTAGEFADNFRVRGTDFLRSGETPNKESKNFTLPTNGIVPRVCGSPTEGELGAAANWWKLRSATLHSVSTNSIVLSMSCGTSGMTLKIASANIILGEML